MNPDDTGPPLPISDESRAQFQSSLLDGLRSGLHSASPGALLGMASMLLSITAHRDVPPERTAQFVRRLVAWDRVEASAGALAMATLAGDVELRRWVRRDLADRRHFVPRWLAEMHRSAPVGRAVEFRGPFREVDEMVVGITMPGGHALTALVRIDNELGARAIGGSIYERPLDTVVERMQPAEDCRVHDISPADARARIEAALTSPLDLDALYGPTEWTAQRPLLRWMLSFLPAGGDATVPGSMEDVDLDDVVDAFLASPWGRPWTRGSLPLLVESVLGDGLGNGVGDPLLWAPQHVRRLLDHDRAPFEIYEHLDAGRTPELLRDLIRYGHAERGLRQELTDRSLAAVDRHAGAFLDAVRAWEADAG